MPSNAHKKKSAFDDVMEDVRAEMKEKKTPHKRHVVEPVEHTIEPEPVAVEVKPVDGCPNCGLPRADFVKQWTGLRTDLKKLTGRKLCPRCFKPVEPY